uniref:Uncharacterized protein n=1 Tax=Anguilla anguilla TaxID=7936 RepID=A0A0E9QVI7_ANGAN
MSESKKEIHGIYKINCKSVGLRVCVCLCACVRECVCEFKCFWCVWVRMHV